ncbi:MAG: phosphatidate cytidylyltransferase [Syntrophomonadaceae bacterium]|jgi:phosphatidate cytidylyltransferase
MLKTRLITTLVGVPLLLVMLHMGEYFWNAVFILMAGIGLWEFFSMMKKKGFTPLMLPGYLLLYSLMFCSQSESLGKALLFLVLSVILISAVWRYPRINIADIALTLFGALYLGLLLYYPIKIATLPDSFKVMVMVLLMTWASDTGGYILGRLLGKHKLAPHLSPGKTWEGACGAAVLPILVAAAGFDILAIKTGSLAYVLVLGLVVGVMAQFGDLFMSSIKRYFEVKDSGWIIPGHGGVLDRFDSFLVVAPLVYYFFLFSAK